jgi:hypothetical protein
MGRVRGCAAAPVRSLAFPRLEPTALDRLWRPLLDDTSELVICIGQPSRIYLFDGPRTNALNEKMIGSESAPPASLEARANTSLNLTELKPGGERYFASGDLMAALRVGEMLGRKGRKFRMLGEKTAAYRDLRGRSVVLIGLNNNKWTMGIMGRLRYYFDHHIGTGRYEIRDRQAGGKAIITAAQGGDAPEEYAIVARVYDRSFEKNVFIVAGMADRSTSAAGEFLTNESYLREAFAKAPSGWNDANVEVVLKTDLVGGTAGPPTVVAEWFW